MTKYILYNTQTQEKILRNSPYLIDGKPPILPENIVELKIIEEPQPTNIELGFIINKIETIDLENKTLTYSYSLVELPVEQKLELAKSEEQVSNLITFNQSINSGIIPQGMIAALAAGEQDRNAFTQLIVLLREHEELLPDENSKEQFKNSFISIADINDNIIVLTVTEFRQAIVNYGFQFNQIWNNFAIRKAAIKTANTLEDLEVQDILNKV